MKTILYASTSAAPITANLEAGQVGLVSHPGSSESLNEDAALICGRGDSLLFAVADGMGGVPGGDRAARTVVESLADHFLAGARAEEAIEIASDAVRALRGPACTLVVGTLLEGQLHTFHVGDAQAILIGGRGTVRGVTMPHSVVGHATEAGILHADEASDHPDRHVVTNAVGEALLRVERTRWRGLKRRDTLLLASDGLFDALSVEAIAERAHRRPLARMMSDLLAEARESPTSHDDLTMIVFRPG